MRSNFTEAQIADVLKQAEEGAPVGEVCRGASISRLAGIRRLCAISIFRHQFAQAWQNCAPVDRPATEELETVDPHMQEQVKTG